MPLRTSTANLAVPWAPPALIALVVATPQGAIFYQTERENLPNHHASSVMKMKRKVQLLVKYFF
jgi:hypothetical protein